MAAAPVDLTTAKDVIDKMEQGVETRLAKANTERGALKQPDDLKAVYDKTFDRLVAAPAVAFENSAKALGSGIDAAIAFVTYINAHRGKLVVSGHGDPSEGPAHLGRAAAADEGLPGRRRAFRRRAAAKRSGTGRELGRSLRHPEVRGASLEGCKQCLHGLDWMGYQESQSARRI